MEYHDTTFHPYLLLLVRSCRHHYLCVFVILLRHINQHFAKAHKNVLKCSKSQMRVFSHEQNLETSKQNAWHTCFLLVCYFLTPCSLLPIFAFSKDSLLALERERSSGVGQEWWQRERCHGKHISSEEKIYHQMLHRSLYLSEHQ